MSLKGNIGSLRKFSQDLKGLGKGMAHLVAKRAAPAITAEARKTYDAGTDPYGTPWRPGADGQAVDLKASGRMFAGLEYKAIGERIRVALNVAYAKFQLGKRSPFPSQDGPLPDTYEAALTKASEETFAAQWRAIQEGR